MDTQPLADGNGGPPTLAVAGSIKTRCPHCHHEDYWTLVGEQYLCSQCGNLAIVVAATGETIEQAIQAVAQEMPEKVEPVQQTLPGTRPAFDVAGALDSIEQAEGEASEAEARYNDAAAKAKYLRKRADDSNQKLREMIQQFSQRRHDSRYEPKESDGERDAPAGTDATGDTPAPPPLSAGHDDASTGEGVEDQRSDAEPDRTGADDGRADADARPELAAGTGTGVIDCSNAGTLAMLHQAGATNITLKQVEVWTEEQVVTARCWADEQIEALGHAEPGTVVSVLWPAHVSLAHHGPEYGKHTPKPRTKKRTTRRRSR